MSDKSKSLNENDIPVKCCRCRHQCMESDWLDKPDATYCTIGSTVKVCPKCGCKSYYDMRPQVAWCWRSGLIEIGDKAPEDSSDGSGAIVIATGPKSYLRGVLSTVAWVSRGELFVPGVHESGTRSKDAVEKLHTWLSQCAKSNGKKRYCGVQFVSQSFDLR